MSTKPEDADTSESNRARGIDQKGSFRQKQIYEILRAEGEKSSRELAECAGVSLQKVRPALGRLKRDDRIVERRSLEDPRRHLYRVNDDE